MAPPAADIRTENLPVRLTDATSTASTGSGANIPINLINDAANIPYNEVQALNTLAASLFYTGTWLVGSSTNIWGIDPGDVSHVDAVTQLLVPFPALSGPLSQQVAGFLEAELPANAACNATTCPPLIPLQPITGVSTVDQAIWSGLILTGLQSFPLLDNFARVPLTTLLSGYTFNSANDPQGIIDNSGPVPTQTYPGANGTTITFLGTTGPNNLMPWAGTTFTLNPAAPFTSFIDSLTADPSTNPIQAPTSTQIQQALWADLAGLVVDFDPFVPGSPFCPGACSLPQSMQVPALVKDILALSPGNPLIEQWLTYQANGQANGPTPAQIAGDTQDWSMSGLFDLSPTTLAQVNALLASINPVLPSIATDGGLVGQGNLNALLADFVKLLGVGGASSASAAAAPVTAARLSPTGSVAAGAGQQPNAPSTPAANPDSPRVAPAGPADPPKSGTPVVTVAPPVREVDQPAQPPAGVPGQSTRQPAGDIAPAPTTPAGGAVVSPVPGKTPHTTSISTTNNPGPDSAAMNTSGVSPTGTTKDKGTPKTNPIGGGSTSSSPNGDRAGAASPQGGKK